MRRAELVINCSILFGGLPLEDALSRVREAGFSAVEFWWPFKDAEPERAEVDHFLKALHLFDLELTGINLFGGDMAAGDRGVLSWPGHEDQFRASVDVAERIKDATGCSSFNALYGRLDKGKIGPEHPECALANLEYACARLARDGGRVALEALSGFPDYPLKTAEDVTDVIASARGDVEGLGMQLDVFHHWANGDDVGQVIDSYREHISHVQLADAPGRGAPGTGELPLEAWIEQLESVGYTGRVALEFVSADEDALTGIRLGDAS